MLIFSLLRRALLCLAALLAVGLAASPAGARSLLILTAQPMQAGKYETIARLGAEAGHTVEYRYVDRPDGLPAPDRLGAYDLVVVDAPFGSALAAAQARLGPLLPAIPVPWIWVHSREPKAHGLPDALVQPLNRYLVEGGRANFAGFLCAVDRQLWGGSGPACPAPVVYPESGLYHPGVPGRILPDLASYLAWKGIDPAHAPPAVGILIHRTHIDSEVTGAIDDLIARIEAKGAVAVAAYLSPMADGEITRLMSLGGKPFVDVIVNTQILLNAEGRRTEFTALGRPVIQAIPYRKGDAAAWEADTVGITPTDIPFYLAQPEYAGLIDPLITSATRAGDGAIEPIGRQAQAVVDKALRLVALNRRPAADKRLAVMFYNYPPGEKNLGASFLNVPRSLETVLGALANAGYRVERRDAEALTAQLTRLLVPFHRPEEAKALIEEGLAATLPLDRYRAWFDSLPHSVRQPILDRWGPPEKSGMVVRRFLDRSFVIPRLQLGNVAILPQPPRGEREADRDKALYHDTKVPPSHTYLATYLWLRDRLKADALVHFGTHGTQEWQPGKERGLDVLDAPLLALGDIPVVYPYIVDNVGEALQAKRRGRAVTVSHATPTFGPAGLHGDITRLHDLLHTWISMEEGEVKAKTADEIRAQAATLGIDKDMETDARTGPFRAFVDRLHTHLHELALTSQPIGLARFGVAAPEEERLLLVLQMLGRPLRVALSPADPDEPLVGEMGTVRQSAAWALLDRHVRQGEPFTGDPKVAALIEQGRQYWAGLSAPRELPGLLAALSGQNVPTAFGGDPIRNPDSLPTGRNLYGFDPSRVPTREAWAAGREAAEKLIASHREKTGQTPRKLAFTLWSVETMRHQGVLEAEVLAVMGFRPVWDQGGRVTGIEPIPRAELKRPRVDAVISATGLYRDHFPGLMKWLATAADQASRIDEPDNAVALDSRAAETELRAQGVGAEDAARLARTRVFSSESGAYSTGLDGATLASDTWGTGPDGKENRKAGDAKLAGLYLDRMQFSYGPDDRHWGEKPPVNAFATHLKGVEGAVLSRSSTLYGMLTTDDPFQYLGGLSLAVRHLGGRSPELYIANLRERDQPRTETAAGFLARDLRTRYFHPGWIAAIQKEGYSGAIEILDAVNNLWGWQATAPETVRPDQWDELKAVYVDDKLKLKINEWFEANHPQAQAQIIERMLEAARKGYWPADPAAIADLAHRWQDLAQRHDIRSENTKFTDFVAQAAAPGFGLSARPAPAEAPQAQPTPPEAQSPAAPLQTVSGRKLERQAQPQPAPFDPLPLLALGLVALVAAAGAAGQARRGAPLLPPLFPRGA